MIVDSTNINTVIAMIIVFVILIIVISVGYSCYCYGCCCHCFFHASFFCCCYKLYFSVPIVTLFVCLVESIVIFTETMIIFITINDSNINFLF